MRYLILLVFFTIFLSPVTKAIEVNDLAVSCQATLESTKSPLSLKKHLGKVIYLDFWASWCPPCKKSIPFLNALQEEFKQKGFKVIAVNVDEDIEAARSFLEQIPVNYSVALDPDGDCPKKYNLLAMPSAYLIDRQGIVRYIHLGFRDADKQEIRTRILELLTEKKMD